LILIAQIVKPPMALHANLKKIYRCEIFLLCELILWSSSVGINRELQKMARIGS